MVVGDHGFVPNKIYHGFQHHGNAGSAQGTAAFTLPPIGGRCANASSDWPPKIPHNCMNKIIAYKFIYSK